MNSDAEAWICLGKNDAAAAGRLAKTDAAGEVRTRDPLLTHKWEADTLTTGLRQLKLTMKVLGM
jgi:hypothetical protein